MKMLTSNSRIWTRLTAVALIAAAVCLFTFATPGFGQGEEISVAADRVEALPTFSIGMRGKLFPYAERVRVGHEGSGLISPEVADPTAVYSNSTTFTSYILFNGGQVSGITRQVADNLALVGTPPHNIGYIYYVICNGNPGPVSARPKIRYYLDNAGSPGTFITGFNFPPATVPNGSCAPFTSRLTPSTQFTVTSNSMWAAMTFDNAAGATATNAQMDLIAMAFFNPPELGTSNNNFHLSSGTPGEFTASNPPGTVQSFVSNPPPDPPDNFGFEIRRRVKLAPFVRDGAVSQPAGGTVSWTVTLDLTDGADGNRLTGLSPTNFALGAGGGATGTVASVVPVGTGNNTWTVTANVGPGAGSLTLNYVTDAGTNTATANTLPFAGGTYVIGGGPIPVAGPGIVISQVYGGGGGSTGTYLFDYVELKNASSSPKSLSGHSLYYGSATGNFGSGPTLIFNLPNVTIPPGGYYLVQTSGTGSAGAPLPVTPDATTTNLSMSGTNGKVALVAGLPSNVCGATPCVLPHFQIVDLVAWGTANNAEGGAATNGGAALTSTQGNVRKNTGCTDTNNNNLDFDVVTAPVPRNSASAASFCGLLTNTRTPNDYDGDGRSDYVVLRDSNGATAGGFIDWYISMNSNWAMYQTTWGIYNTTTEDLAPADYDGDGKADIAVYRRGAPLSNFYIILSKTNILWTDQLGLTNDDPVPADYNGDGNADLAVVRNNGNDTSSWFYRPNFFSDYLTLNVPDGGARAGGDYDGDGRWDPASFSDGGGGAGRFTVLLSGSGVTTIDFGNATDFVVPGDYDGDGKSDACTVRKVGGFLQWQFKKSSDGLTVVDTWGFENDLPTPGDYNGDGKFDYAIWREGAQSEFFIMTPFVHQIFTRPWGLTGDYPVATASGVSNGI